MCVYIYIYIERERGRCVISWGCLPPQLISAYASSIVTPGSQPSDSERFNIKTFVDQGLNLDFDVPGASSSGAWITSWRTQTTARQPATEIEIIVVWQ